MNRDEMEEKGKHSNKQYYNVVVWSAQRLKDFAPVITPRLSSISYSLLVQSQGDINLLLKDDSQHPPSTHYLVSPLYNKIL